MTAHHAFINKKVSRFSARFSGPMTCVSRLFYICWGALADSDLPSFGQALFQAPRLNLRFQSVRTLMALQRSTLITLQTG